MKKTTFRDFIAQRETFDCQWEAVSAILRLSAEGASVPFIATYRRDQTGGLKGDQIREILRLQNDYKDFVGEKAKAIKKIQGQKGVDEEWVNQMESCKNSGELSELQRLYGIQRKIKTLAGEQAGLMPLARWILDQGKIQGCQSQKQGQSRLQEDPDGAPPLSQQSRKQGRGQGQNQTSDQVSLETKAKEFVSQKAGFVTYQEILRAVKKIIVKKILAQPKLYRSARDFFLKEGILKSEAGKKAVAKSKYQKFFKYEHKLESLFSSNSMDDYLTLHRGWKEGELKVSMEIPDSEKLLKKIKKSFFPNEKSISKDFLDSALETALNTYIIPGLQEEIHKKLGERAEDKVIRRSCKRLKKLLLTPPLCPASLPGEEQNGKIDLPLPGKIQGATGGKAREDIPERGSGVVLGVYPCGKNVCQLALVDEKGRFISGTILKIDDGESLSKAVDLFSQLLKQIQVQAVSVAWTRGFRETESFIRKIFQFHLTEKIPVTLVDGLGAKLYGATGVLEFPDEKASVRSAVFTARYLQDPLFELVKVDCVDLDLDPYQKEVSPDRFKEAVSFVVEDCVHFVGVDVNRASSFLLKEVSGISGELAGRIVSERERKGFFKTREDLGHLSGWTSSSYKQALGFLRVFEGPGPLDKTGIHPENYGALRDMSRELGKGLSDLFSDGADSLLSLKQKWSEFVGEYGFDFVHRELKSQGRDTRGQLKIFQFRKDLFSLEDMKEGMVCEGLVSNLAPFGFFVNIGIHTDGLVHLSEMPASLKKSFEEDISPGDQVSVKVKTLDHEKGQFNLTMRFGDQAKSFEQKRRSQKTGTTKLTDSSFKKQREDLKKENQTRVQGLNQRVRKGELKNRRKDKNKKNNKNGKTHRGGGRHGKGTPFNNPFQVLQSLKK